eukprot:CAMPEP_0184326578 /NCGR_PEP_ID=MMETSP1049-20130417/142638_1 /TAXON_ID=77928 /ORGANISM="Proteomonas sulcata, Strain CCMP704" /LENGTH=109 /DNA_ID=CAMNT_0026648781 /DNA_START=552 /DNA_END=881 /DNA_ORIENTATION=+
MMGHVHLNQQGLQRESSIGFPAFGSAESPPAHVQHLLPFGGSPVSSQMGQQQMQMQMDAMKQEAWRSRWWHGTRPSQPTGPMGGLKGGPGKIGVKAWFRAERSGFRVQG